MKADSFINKNVGRVSPQTETLQKPDTKAFKGEFEEALKSLRESVKPKLQDGSAVSDRGALKFSNHAIERMRARGLAFSPEQLTRIEQGIEKAARKGAQNTLLVSDGAALIVSVKNNTVVTVMDPNQMKDSVVTNIDSTVLV